MKVLVTGGSGFIGSHIVDRLLERGDEVVVVDNFATCRRDNLEPQDGLEVVEGTVADAALIDELVARQKPDVIVHAAAAYKDPDDWAEQVRTNVLGSANVAQSAQRHGVKRLINFQTALCYGMRPLEQPITLNHPVRPEGSSYAISKVSGEQYVQLGGVECISFRLANAYGPRSISGPLPTFYHRLTTGQRCSVMDTRRDFIYVADLVDCVMLAVDGRGKPGAYHISSGTDYAIKDLFDATVKALGITLAEPVEVRPRFEDDVQTILLDPSRTNAELGWKATTPLDEGIAASVDYYRTHGISELFTHLKSAKAS